MPGRRHGWRILAVAVVVSLITALAEIAGTELVDRASPSVSIVADLSASGLSLLGAVFLSGFVCRLVDGADDEAGDRDSPSVRAVLRTRPWGRLVLADLLVALVVVAGLFALVIPGLIAINLLGIVGPVIEIEDRKVIAGLRRSAQLVWRHFWTVALLVTLPVALAGEIDAVTPEPHSAATILANLALRGLAEALVEAAIALIEVKLCYRLIELESPAREPGGPDPG